MYNFKDINYPQITRYYGKSLHPTVILLHTYLYTYTYLTIIEPMMIFACISSLISAISSAVTIHIYRYIFGMNQIQLNKLTFLTNKSVTIQKRSKQKYSN